MTTTDPLSRLEADEGEVNREFLASALESYIRLDSSRGTFAFLNGARARLNTRGRAMAALLAQKALHLRRSELPVSLEPKGITERTGVQGGTLRPILKAFADRGLVRREERGTYSVPNYAIEDAAELLASSESHAGRD